MALVGAKDSERRRCLHPIPDGQFAPMLASTCNKHFGHHSWTTGAASVLAGKQSLALLTVVHQTASADSAPTLAGATLEPLATTNCFLLSMRNTSRGAKRASCEFSRGTGRGSDSFLQDTSVDGPKRLTSTCARRGSSPQELLLHRRCQAGVSSAGQGLSSRLIRTFSPLSCTGLSACLHAGYSRKPAAKRTVFFLRLIVVGDRLGTLGELSRWQ